MAERARARKGAKAKGATAKRANGKANGAGHNGGPTLPLSGVPDEVYKRWLGKLDAQIAVVERLKTPYDSAKAKLQNLYKAAKADGYNTDADRNARAVEKQDRLTVIQNQRDTGRILRLRKSPLVEQYDLFPEKDFPAPVNANLQGLLAGKQGALYDNPHVPGTEEFVSYKAGYDTGQEENRESLRDE